MYLLEISIETRVIVGISAMVLLFASFLITFITSQRKKLQYHKDLQLVNEQKQQILTEQNELLEERVRNRTLELFQQKETLQTTLADLKATQLQLIQKEKMASLGELTAGIAHEIQNPLNFVNNFSELNIELLSEVMELITNESDLQETKGNLISMLQSINENSKRINLHGKRADSIVKAMLQHSSSSSGEKQLTDFNALVDEFLRVSFHGVRAKDKLFNATIKTTYDETVGKIKIASQDIGRVLINLFNNAFYSINEKRKQKGKDYTPTVIVTTKSVGSKLELKIRDNGNGIPKKFIDKICQPFFTTKPTGVGTGLGLSLSYDIIKAHQGELIVDSVEGEFAEFTVILKY
jgi:two-component system, NtrC family, sensor kinase